MSEHHLPPVATPREPVTTTYHGVPVVDDYQWLEDATSHRTRAWTHAQDRRTREYLAGRPAHADVVARVGEVLRAESVSYEALRWAGGRFFVLTHQPPKQQPVLVVLDDVDDPTTAQVVVDPTHLDPSGATTIDFFHPSPDGRFVAVSLSSDGTEEGTVHVFDVRSGEQTGDVVPHVCIMDGSLAWAGDVAGFWHTRVPQHGERAEEDRGFYQEAWFHWLRGAPAHDRRDLTLPVADARIAEHFLTTSADGRWALDRVQKGDGGQWEIFVRPQHGADWWQVAALDDRVVDAALGPNDTLYLVSRHGSPRGRVLRLPLRPGVSLAEAVEVVPEADVVIDAPDLFAMNGEGGIVVTEAHLWLLDMVGGVSSLRRFDLDGKPAGEPLDLPPVTAIAGLTRVGPDAVMFATQSFVEPMAWWVASGAQRPRRTALAEPASVDLSALHVWRDEAVSRDGTRVPITLVGPRSATRDDSLPVLLTGYGGYGVSYKPWYKRRWLPWLEQGWVVAVAHIRGGGEYGQAWHHAGRLTHKQNSFDDFAACARHLLATVTTPERLAIQGGSNGGLLMGAVLTQHPDLARAVVATVPPLDMLRSGRDTNGVFNVPEVGSIEDPAMFRILHAYSPYHAVRDGTAYPAVLLTAGELDPRVEAYHAKKMTARLQAATSSARPVLLRVEASGHGLGSSLDQQVDEYADIYTFLVDELGLTYRRPSA